MIRSRFLVLAVAAGLAACSSSTRSTSSTGPTVTTDLVSVAPAGGATGIAVDTSIRMHFSGAMMMSMDSMISLHQGDATGALVPCTKVWSSDSTTFTMTPMSPLAPGTHYTIMLGAGMMDADGHSIDMTTQGMPMGGQCMSGGGMGGGGMMGGTCSGMEFGFTTS